MAKYKKEKGTAKVSPNWQALQKKLQRSDQSIAGVNQKKLKHEKLQQNHSPQFGASAQPSSSIASTIIRSLSKRQLSRDGPQTGSDKTAGLAEPSTSKQPFSPGLDATSTNNDIGHLRRMVLGKLNYSPSDTKPGKYIAIDCEMVTAKGGQRSLARVSLVNLFGATVLDTFVRQNAPVVDYKTHVSGVRPRDLSNQSAIPFEDAQKSVRELLKDRILVGHALQHDLKVLKLSHPHYMCRDTSRYSGATGPTPALKSLVQKELGIHIQDGEHDSITDARAAMALYRLRKEDWERPASQNPKTLEEPVEEADHSIAPDDEPGPGLEPGPPDGIHIHVAMNSKTPSKSKRQPGRTANIASKKTKSKLSSAVSQKKGSDDNHPKKRANRNGNSKTNHSSNQGNWWATL